MPAPEPQSHDQPLYRLIVEIRTAFQALKMLADQMHADLGVTAAERAVMEYLAGNGPTTVPDIARSKLVTRQHVQLLADALAAKGLAEAVVNPAHQKSKLIALTDKGGECFAAMRRREAMALSDLAEGLAPADLRAAAATVRTLRERVAAQGRGPSRPNQSRS
jgi:DNA-binding MarR family transcriptional regulator